MNTQAELERQIERLQQLLKERRALTKKTMRYCFTVLLLLICVNQLSAQDQAAFALQLH
jgi:hypothetical protein